MIFGYVGNARFWSEHNNDLCVELRKNPTCVESTCGFTCPDFYGKGSGFVTGGSICADKDMSLCVIKF